MKIIIVLTISILHLLDLTSCHNNLIFCKTVDVPDYYWRDYRGVIPFDAIPAGTDRAGMTTYIGQSLILPYGLLVGSIYHGNKSVAGTAALKTFYVEKNVKILCSGSPEKFKWITTNTDKIQLITYCHLVWGGDDRGYELNIGRINHIGEIIVGKVLTTATGSNGLWVPSNGPEIQFKQFEVLAYDCKPHADIKTMISAE